MTGRFERKIVLLLAAAAVLPLASAWYVADQLVSHSLHVGLNPRVGQALEHLPETFRAFVTAKKEAYRSAFGGLTRSSSLRAALDTGDHARVEGVLRAFVDGHPRAVEARVRAGGDTVVAEASRPATGPEDSWRPLPLTASLPPAGAWSGLTVEATFVVSWEPFREFEEDVRALETYRTLVTSQQRLTGGYRIAFGLSLGAVVILTALTGFVLARRVTAPIGPLIAMTRRVAEGDLDVRAPAGPDDEIGDLCRAFDVMVARMRADRERIVFLSRLSASQDIARRLAHEIKNPLTPITLAVQQLRERYPGGDDEFGGRLRTAVEIVEEEVGALRRLVDEFREFGRLPPVEPEPSDLAEQVRHFVDAHDAFADRGTVSVSVEAPSDDPVPVSLDRDLFRRVLVNLVDNAIEAGGGTVRLSVRRTPGGEAELRVDDDGPGVPESDRDDIFEPYRTGKPTGTGLGLSIVKKVVLDHGGSIRVARSPLGGAAFVVRLPATGQTSTNRS